MVQIRVTIRWGRGFGVRILNQFQPNLLRFHPIWTSIITILGWDSLWVEECPLSFYYPLAWVWSLDLARGAGEKLFWCRLILTVILISDSIISITHHPRIICHLIPLQAGLILQTERHREPPRLPSHSGRKAWSWCPEVRSSFIPNASRPYCFVAFRKC